MREEFLWHIWKFRLFDNKELHTVSGEEIKILKVGEHNTDSGPDFFNARIKIGEIVWAGNVEVHVNSSGWRKHKHTCDGAYDNIILHVVYEAGEKLFRKSGEEIPTLELKNKFPQDIYDKYLQFKSSGDWIPCETQFSSVDRFTLNHCIDRLLTERMERKSKAILDLLKRNKNNWEETFYQMLARSFGQKINEEPFELLARSLPASVLAKHKNNFVQTEALLFGVAGMLARDFKDEYANDLKKEFEFLKRKFKLQPIDASLWKFMRLHPPNFPTIRISQFANLMVRSSHLFSKMLEANSVKQVVSLFETETSWYWQAHYQFGKISPKKNKKLGCEAIHAIIINAVVPVLFVYGKNKAQENLCSSAISFLEEMSAEKNSIIEKWRLAGVEAMNAYETQALLQLKHEYCSRKRCLECGVGARLLNPLQQGEIAEQTIS